MDEVYPPLVCNRGVRSTNDRVDENNYDNMPLMDSFLKETTRIYPTVICKHSLYHLGDDGSL